MTNALRASSQFRSQNASDSGVSKSDNHRTSHKEEAERQKPDRNSENLGGKSKKLSPKDVRVIKQLVIISLVYILCNIPKLARTVGDALEPEFMLGRRYEHFYDIVTHIQLIVETAKKKKKRKIKRKSKRENKNKVRKKESGRQRSRRRMKRRKRRREGGGGEGGRELRGEGEKEEKGKSE
ncbi:hypothetical protein PoB_001429600 [Plakobranchus ocellatus]|uniref:Uncharacterized protein n=1 Tax=Plakobranchus ocellatus TaxID=259542 RepID=A0AAV3YZM6_9GAST|nr:hypothetical protein PoB_001429600 [Plakobranchus ocellatus]